MRILIAAALLLALAACQEAPENSKPDTADAGAPDTTVDTSAAQADTAAAGSLAAILAAQPEDMQARYVYRHPQETLEFFGIEPGMTVVEGLPGGGWYSRLLLAYLGDDGRLIGADYSLEMFPLFPFGDEAFMEKRRLWTETFKADAAAWAGDSGVSVEAFHFGAMPEEFAGTADVVFFARALHNLARFESEGDYLTSALGDAYAVLKPGGVFGVVQHHARDERSDSFADGSNGYLKKAFVIAAAEQAGFEFVAESDINANPADQPSEDDIVWRLPPSLRTSQDDPELRAQYLAIGESNRMTLKFRKPE